MAIYDKVLKAMQEAEEMGGPLGDEYMALMTEIAAEAIRRMQVYRSSSYMDDLKMNIQPKPKVMSLEEFRKTGHNNWNADEPIKRIYDGKCEIELCDDGEWLLTICNEQHKDSSLRFLEEILYRDWYVREISH